MRGLLSLFASLNASFLKADEAFQVLTRLPFAPPGNEAMESSLIAQILLTVSKLYIFTRS